MNTENVYTLSIKSVDSDGADVFSIMAVPTDANVLDYVPKRIENIVAMSIEPIPPKEMQDVLQHWMNQHVTEISKNKMDEIAKKYREQHGMHQITGIDFVASTVPNKPRYAFEIKK